ncbi:hypothetical protein BJI47_22615 [Rhodococcus sp. 1168]|nr:hypothetical protein BJI47_22615 [Rhodococcus sp. 1168]
MVRVTHRLDSGFDAAEVFPGVLVVDGLGAVLADSVQARGVTPREVGDAGEFDVPDDVMADANEMAAIVARRLT